MWEILLFGAASLSISAKLAIVALQAVVLSRLLKWAEKSLPASKARLLHGFSVGLLGTELLILGLDMAHYVVVNVGPWLA